MNSGSSSIKYQLVDPVGGEAIASGIVERIGEDEGSVRHTYARRHDASARTPIADHGAGLRAVLALFEEVGPDLAQAHVVAVGHRVVHGGAVFGSPVVVDDDVVAQIDALSPLAPLHNPPNLTGIRVARELLPDVPHVVVFDTAFFRTLPEAAATYAIDREVAARARGAPVRVPRDVAPVRVRHRSRACSAGGSRTSTRSCCTWATGRRRRRSAAASPSRRRWA